MRVVTDISDDEGPRFSSTLSWSESPFTPAHAPRPALPASSSGQITKRRRPTVLFLNEGKAHEATQKRLESLAHVYYLVPREDEDGPAAIRRAVKTHGPFIATVYLPGFTNRVQWTMNRETLGPLSPSCKLFSAPGAGYDKVDVEWMTEVGAYYANNPIEVGRRTAQWALALILDSMRGVSAQFLSARAGNWVNRDVRSIDWLGATLGIIGMGNIGSQVAAAATSLGLRVVYSNRHPSEDMPYEYVSKEDLYARSDVILLLTPLTEETRGMVNKHSISQMRDGVIIVNVARGPVIVEQDLVDALESGKVMRVALDVFEREPEIHPALKSNPNALITPHSAASTTNLLPEILNEMVSNVVKFLETGKPNTPVNEPKRV